jgi:polyhydroxyalkanoate synthesis regulator phasin
MKSLVEKADYARRSEVKALEERVRQLEERLAAEAKTD